MIDVLFGDEAITDDRGLLGSQIGIRVVVFVCFADILEVDGGV